MALKPPPQQQMAGMLTGYWISQAIYVAAKLGIADLLIAEPRTADELAAETGMHARSLYRLLRALASVGVFAERGDQRFELTPLAECLRSDVPGSQRALAMMVGEEHYYVWGDLIHSIQTGEPAFDKIYGMPVFEFLAHSPAKAQIFDEAMVGIHGRETAAMLDTYDFSQIGVLCDVGGGNGSLLLAVLERYPKLQGMLYDLPHVVERARQRISTHTAGPRCEAIGGSFFDHVPQGADAYLMRHIIHDWNEEKASLILRNCAKAMRHDARLLLIESVIPPGNDPYWPKFLDLNMLAIPGGQERTEAEYRELLDSSGLRLTRISPTGGGIDVIEAVKA